MMGKLLNSEIAPRKLTISAAEPLRFNSSIARFIKSGIYAAYTILGDL